MNTIKNIFKMYIEVFKQITLKGRMSRKDYWTFFIINVAISFGLDFISNEVYHIFLGVSILPGFCAGWRRIQDAGYKGWFILIPVVGFITLFFKRKEEVEIGVKIFTNNFPEVPWLENANSNQVTNFLLSDCGCSFTNNGSGELVKGDKCIWYLGLSDKFGKLRYKDQVIEWGFNEADFNIVESFVQVMYLDGFLNKHQNRLLNEAIEEGRKIKSIYEIGDYLKNKQI
jgi:uncharacterized membrane protein YhaH (DUF805 family)